MQQSSSQPVSVTASLTRDDIFRAMKTYFSKRKKAQQRRIILAIALCLFPFATYFFIRWYLLIMRPKGWIDLSPEQVNTVTVILVLIAMTVAVGGIVYLFTRRRATKLHLRIGLERYAALCTFTFSDSIEYVTPSESGSVEYSDISEVLEDFYGLLIVPNTGPLIYLPTRVLYGDELRTVKKTIYQHRFGAASEQ